MDPLMCIRQSKEAGVVVVVAAVAESDPPLVA